MSIKERIEAMNLDFLPDDSQAGYEIAKDQAAEIAEEADEIMEDMAVGLDILLTDGFSLTADDALERYKEFKESQ